MNRGRFRATDVASNSTRLAAIRSNRRNVAPRQLWACPGKTNLRIRIPPGERLRSIIKEEPELLIALPLQLERVRKSETS